GPAGSNATCAASAAPRTSTTCRAGLDPPRRAAHPGPPSRAQHATAPGARRVGYHAAMNSRPAGPDRLTVVVAAFNEAQALPSLHPRIAAVLDGLAGDIDGRVLYVDDGSSDGTWDVLLGIANGDARVSLLRLSRNFGKEAALTAGLDRVEEGAARSEEH